MRNRLMVAVVGVMVLVSAPSRRGPAPAPDYLEWCRLVAIPGNAFTSVPAPEIPAFAADAATITVTYGSGFAAFPTAQAAFQAAVDIWKGQISSPVAIRVQADFTTQGANILGSAGPNRIFRDFTGARIASSWYPDALADRLRGLDGFPSGPDIVANFNSAFSAWYFGTDGHPPAGQYDFESVVLHELGHGLGFFGAANVTSGVGSISESDGNPDAFDRFVGTETGAPILTAFVNPSAALGTQLQQGNSASNLRAAGAYWTGANGVSGNGGLSARLYTPSTWSGGSSYSHLDELTYPAGNANSLMTYALSAAESIHAPGPVTLGMFTDLGWDIACAGTLGASGATVARTAGTGTVSVTIASTCAWTAAVNSGTFLTVTSGASGTGNGTVAFSFTANSGAAARTGTLTIASQTFTVTQLGNSITLSPATLNFSGTNTAGTLSPITGPQTVTVTAGSSSGTPAWTVAASQPWVQINGGGAATGSGSSTFTIGIINPSNVLGASTSVTATVTVTATNVTNSPQTVAINLTLRQASANTVPFGQVDSPSQSQTGVQGAIGVTGWALDDVGVAGVKIYRNCLPVDAPASCQVLGGASVVFVGDAAFLAGARPDVEASFSTLPQAYRAGWGYLMLTNLLPHVTNSLAFGGQGPLTLYAFATDIEGNVTLLGRSTADHVPTSIAMANDSIAKPFGAIDFPTQGQTISGVFANFGWALTPDSNTVADATDILIPTNGSTMVVFIDSVAVATVAFNQCRGTVGNPVPAGVFCNDDVADIFGNPTPQTTPAPRTSNPTKYRNLDASRSAIGAYTINTTTMTNGLHNIAWSVTDSAGRNEGIGSRNFTVLNSLGDAPTADAPAMVRGDAASLSALMPSAVTIWARTGFDLAAPWAETRADARGVRHISVEELGRVELWLEATETGYLVANGTLRDLPPGSHLDPATGQFSWTPAVGYHGTYRLAFLRGTTRTIVEVTIR